MKSTKIDKATVIHPYIVKIRNLTSSKIENVPVFNYEHKEQRDIKYENESGASGFSYGELLKWLASQSEPKQKISKLVIMTPMQSHYLSEQLLGVITEVTRSLNGSQLSVPHQPILSPYQNQSNIVECDDMNMELYVLTNLELEYLMPDMEIHIRIYATLIEDK